jgi:magnesium-transporting ATPase (P-type)
LSLLVSQSYAAAAAAAAVIIINTAIGMLQEGKAEKAAEAIKAMLSPNALVIRAGEQQTIPADELVPGDIVLLKSGDKVPADLRLITCTNLQVSCYDRLVHELGGALRRVKDGIGLLACVRGV